MSLIEVKGLRKSYDCLEVLKGVDLNVEQGERIAIIGGSGCACWKSRMPDRFSLTGKRSLPRARKWMRSAGAWAWYSRSSICLPRWM